MRRTHEEPGDRGADAPPPPSSDAFHRPTMQVGADVFSRSTVPGEYPALAIERAIHDVPDEVVEAHVEPVIAAPSVRMTLPIAAAFAAPAALPFAAPRVVRDAPIDRVERATRPAIPRALPSSPSFTRTSEDLPPASISLSPITTGRSSVELSPMSAAPRRSSIVPVLAVGVAIAIAGVVAVVARRAPAAEASSQAAITSPRANVVAAPIETVEAATIPAAPETTTEPPSKPKQGPRAPRAEAKVDVKKAARAPAQPKAANRPFDVED